MGIETVGVVGAGVIGTGVAQSLAQAGVDVLLVDLTPEILERSVQTIQSNLRLLRLFARRGEEPPAGGTAAERVSVHTAPDVLSGADFVIENITEHRARKQELFARLDRICAPDVVLATNTSCIPVATLAAVTRRPARVLGMHFMNPVPMIATVEVIRTAHTSEETLARTRALLERMGKDGVIVNDSPGFVTNRILMLMINEAIALVQEEVAPPDAVDKIFRSCCGHKMGPLEVADMIGLDTILRSLEVLRDSLDDERFEPRSLLRSMVDRGLLGDKSGEGFYRRAGTEG